MHSAILQPPQQPLSMITASLPSTATTVPVQEQQITCTDLQALPDQGSQ